MALKDISLANYFDQLGTTYNLPELGLSELLAGGKRTINTGNQNVYGTDSKPAEYYTQAPYGTEPVGPAAPQQNAFIGPAAPTRSLRDVAATGASTGASATPGSGAAATAPAAASIVELGGRMFDLSDPAQADAYYQAANADSFGVANQNYNTTHQNIARSRDNLNYNTGQSLEELKRQRAQLMADKENYFTNLEKQGRDFVTGKMVGDNNRQNFFSGLGANAFQSSQASSQDFADNKFAQGLAEQQKAKADAENKYTNQFGAYDTNEQNINRQAAQDAQDLQLADSNALFQRDNFINTNKGKLAGQLAQVGADQGWQDYSSRFKVDPYSNVNISQPDLSAVQPFTNFQPASSGTGAAPTGSKFSTLTPSQMDPQDQYFGYTPDDKTKSRIKNYFSGSLA